MRTYHVTAAMALLLVTACGDDGGTTPQASKTPALTAPAGGVVEVQGTAALKFLPDKLFATKGEPFKGRFVQVGAIPHNLEIKDFGVKAEDTTTTKASESKEFSFTPDKSGEFAFVCTIHAGQMTGKLTVT